MEKRRAYEYTSQRIREIPPHELPAHWRSKYEALATTVMSEASGTLDPEVRDILRSDEWLYEWNDALVFSRAQMETAIERMHCTGESDRMNRARRRLDEICARLGDTDYYIKTKEKEEALQDPVMAHTFITSKVAASYLSIFHQEEFEKIAADIRARTGLPDKPPFWGDPAADKVDQIERAARYNLIGPPIGPRAEQLLEMSDFYLNRTVSEDARNQDNREKDLRHPLLLNDWMASLHDVVHQTGPTAGAIPDTMHLAPLDYPRLHRMTETDVRNILRARRFFRGLQQRINEWNRLVNRVSRTAVIAQNNAEKPWLDARWEARNRIATIYPDQYSALLRALDAFTIPGTDQLERSRYEIVRKQVKDQLIGCLKDGTWRNIP
jgi:hypothetical protein